MTQNEKLNKISDELSKKYNTKIELSNSCGNFIGLKIYNSVDYVDSCSVLRTIQLELKLNSINDVEFHSFVIFKEYTHIDLKIKKLK